MTEADFDDDLSSSQPTHTPRPAGESLLPDYLGHQFDSNMKCRACGMGWGKIIHEGNIGQKSMVCKGKPAPKKIAAMAAIRSLEAPPPNA